MSWPVRALRHSALCTFKTNSTKRNSLGILYPNFRNTQKETPHIEFPDAGGNTPLHLAASHGHVFVVKTLLDEGANINACNRNKETPLHLAAANGHLEVVQDLLKAKAYFSVVDGQQRSALYRAVESGYNRVVDLLVGAGARFGQLPPVSFFDRSTQTVGTGHMFPPEPVPEVHRGHPYPARATAPRSRFCLLPNGRANEQVLPVHNQVYLLLQFLCASGSQMDPSPDLKVLSHRPSVVIFSSSC
jgi:ankyrin repeat protein